MHKLIFTMLFGVLLLSAGCVRSLHPMYTEKDLVFEPSLIGQWAEDDSKEIWAFSKADTNAYQLVYTDDTGAQGTFNVRLLNIEGNLFLDFFPAELDLKENAFYVFHLLPVHTFVRVKQIEPTLQMSSPDLDWLKKHIAADPGAIRHEKLGDEIILTAAVKDLQAFWLKHLDTEGAFGDPIDLKRKKRPVPEKQPSKSAEGDGLKPAP